MERSNTFARAVCAAELYDLYYSGKKIDFNNTDFRNTDPNIISFIISAGAIVGPLLSILATVVYFIFRDATKKQLKEQQRKENEENSKNTTNRRETLKIENLVALACVGIYISIYIWILDAMTVHVVSTARHEYKQELAGRITFNLSVVYFTFFVDSLAILFFVIIAIAYKWKFSKYSLLIPPCVCCTSHFGYILLAWISAPSRSTTTLILYYFLFFYLFLTIRKSYTLFVRIKYTESVKRCANAGQPEAGQSGPQQPVSQEADQPLHQTAPG